MICIFQPKEMRRFGRQHYANVWTNLCGGLARQFQKRPPRWRTFVEDVICKQQVRHDPN